MGYIYSFFCCCFVLLLSMWLTTRSLVLFIFSYKETQIIKVLWLNYFWIKEHYLWAFNFISALWLFSVICEWWKFLWWRCPEGAKRKDICRHILHVSCLSCWFLVFLTFGLSWCGDDRGKHRVFCLTSFSDDSPSDVSESSQLPIPLHQQLIFSAICNPVSPAFLSPVQIEELVTFSSTDRKIKGWAAVTKRS